jgi:hypothetical protein
MAQPRTFSYHLVCFGIGAVLAHCEAGFFLFNGTIEGSAVGGRYGKPLLIEILNYRVLGK